jgi:glycosyltransferase involved in cell wall biosynthesis
MRILHIITSLRIGGAEHLLVDLLPQLSVHGHAVEVLAFDGTKTGFYERLEQAGIPIHFFGIGYGEMYNPLNYFRLKRFFSQHTYDIVHTHNTPCQLLVAMLKRHFSLNLVTTEHNTTNRRRKWSWLRPMDRWMYRQYGAVICVSEKTKTNLIQSLGDKDLEERIHLVYNGVQLANYHSSANHNKESEKQVLMVAGFRTQKDQPTLIRAFKLLPEDYHLILVGDGPCRKACETLAESLNIAHRVTFTGVRTDVPELLAKAEVVVLSSHYEGMPLACIEAMAAGKPVIASAVDGLQEVVEGAGLLFPHQDAQQLETLIERICTDDALRAEVARKCLARASQYDLTRMVEAYLKIYEAQPLRL